MKKSRWLSVAAGSALALAFTASEAFELRFSANDAQRHVIFGLVNVVPLATQATDTVVQDDGVSWRRFTGQAEGLLGWVVEQRDGLTLVWGTQQPQDFVVDNYLFPNGASRTVLRMQGRIDYSDVQRDVGTIDLTYSCACSDLFLPQGTELVEKAFERRDSIAGLAAIEKQALVWVPEQPGDGGHAEWRITERQEIAFGTAVPEPAAWAMGVAGAAVLAMRGGLRRRKA